MQTVQKNDVVKSDSFKWIIKQKNYNRDHGSDDILISIASAGVSKKGNKRGERVCIHFYNKSAKRVTQTGYLMFGIDGDRLYFCSTDSVSGYKVSSKAYQDTGVVQSSDSTLVEWAKTRRGSYTLHQDSKSELYYIQGKSIG